MATTAVIASAGIALVFFVTLVDLVLVQYARGIAQLAVDEAVRVGRTDATAEGRCRAVGEEIMADLLGGPIGADLAFECDVQGSRVVAIVDGTLRAISPLMPDVGIRRTARAAVG